MKELTVDQFIQMDKAIPIDVRSPIEFEECSIPGAVNIPLFTNEERVEIGTLYKQEGSDAAKWRAMEIVSPKIPSMLKQIKDLHTKGFRPIVYCWRGGMRSKAVATFLAYAGTSFPRLIGGYRAYRQYILEKTPELIPSDAVILHGMTGVGKTEVLKKLNKEGFPIVDLEGIAAHRGSIFGTFGMDEGHNQKTFDAMLYQSLSQIKGTPFFIMEAESKRIGKAIQPEELLSRKKKGTHILMGASLSSRVNRLYKEYVEPFQQDDWFQPKLIESLLMIKKRLKDQEVISQLDEAVQMKDYKTVIRSLLENYYDPRYAFKQHEYEGHFHEVNAEDIDTAVSVIAKIVEEKGVLVR